MKREGGGRGGEGRGVGGRERKGGCRWGGVGGGDPLSLCFIITTRIARETGGGGG